MCESERRKQIIIESQPKMKGRKEIWRKGRKEKGEMERVRIPGTMMKKNLCWLMRNDKKNV